MKTWALILICLGPVLGPCFTGMCQDDQLKGFWMSSLTNNFDSIRSATEGYYMNRDQGRGSGYKQWKRWERENALHLTSEGQITNYTARNVAAYLSYRKKLELDKDFSQISVNGEWSAIGPSSFNTSGGHTPGMGRVNAIAFHPTNPQIIWAGTPAGGLWKTINDGVTWEPLTDGMPTIGVSGIAVNPSDPNIIYILTGDGDAGHTSSVGVLKTMDGGIMWQSTGLTFSISLTSDVWAKKLLMNPQNPSVLFAATSAGLFKTTDAGNNWTKVLNVHAVDVEYKPGDTSIIYASSGINGNTRFYRSVASGSAGSWINNQSVIPDNCKRIAISVTSAAPDVVYILCGGADGPGQFKGLYISTDCGQTFRQKSDQPNILGYDNNGGDGLDQAWYDLALAVSPLAANQVMAGGINAWSSADSGATWTLLSYWNYKYASVGYTHADIHALEINPLNNILYCGSDGGIIRSSDFGQNWTDRSAGLAITQWYKMAVSHVSPHLISGGTQDNGYNVWNGGSVMEHQLGGDGGDCFIDDQDTNLRLAQIWDGANTYLYRTISGGYWWNLYSTFSDGGINNFVVNPLNPSSVYMCGKQLMKSVASGLGWTNLNGRARNVAVAASDTNRLYKTIGRIQNGDTLLRSGDGGYSWDTLYGYPQNNIITSITVNPFNADMLYITYAGYYQNNKVISSTDGGTTWNDITGTLPNVPVLCSAYDPSLTARGGSLYIGTDIGVFYRDDLLNDWIPYMNGLPVVPVKDMDIDSARGLIRVCTFGRGLWESPLLSCPFSYNLTQANNTGNYTGWEFYQASGFIESSRFISGGPGTKVNYKAGNFIKLILGFHGNRYTKFHGELGPCYSTASPSVKTLNGILLSESYIFKPD